MSILIPVYKVELFVEKCARSLFGQSYPHIEYIFVDDCSPDDSINIIKNVLKDYPERKNSVVFLKHKINKGLSSARNTALDIVSGKYIFFVDSDDYLEENTIERLYFQAIDSDSDIVLCDVKQVYANKSIVKKICLPDTLNEYLCQVLMRQTYLCVWGKLYKKELFENVRFIDGVTLGEDYATLPRVVYYARTISKVDYPLYNYVKYNETSCTARMKQKSIDDAYIVRTKLIEFFTQIPDANKYNVVLSKSMLYFKLHMVKACAFSLNLIKQIAAKWGHANDEYIHILPFRDRLIMRLLNAKMWSLLKIYLGVGLYLIKLKSLLK